MEYEINMDESYKGIDPIDEWGCAYVWDKNIGAEYNYCVEGNENMCAIYFMSEDTKENWQTDSNRFVHYEIDWCDPNWKQKLIDEMIKIVKRWRMENE